MQIVIDIPKSRYKEIVSGIFDADGYFKTNLTLAFRNGTPIPDNVTNGDVIKAMFSNGKCSEYFADVEMKTEENDTRFKSVFDRDWWDAPYQKGGKE